MNGTLGGSACFIWKVPAFFGMEGNINLNIYYNTTNDENLLLTTSGRTNKSATFSGQYGKLRNRTTACYNSNNKQGENYIGEVIFTITNLTFHDESSFILTNLSKNEIKKTNLLVYCKYFYIVYCKHTFAFPKELNEYK